MRSATVAMTAAFAMAGCTPAPQTTDQTSLPTLPPVNTKGMDEAFDIIKVKNSRGQTSTIVVVDNERYDALIESRDRDKKWIRYDDQSLGSDITAYLQKNGFNEASADHIGRGIAEAYRPGKYNPAHPFPFYNRYSIGTGPHAIAIGIEDNIKYNPPQVAQECSVIRLSNAYNGEAWVRSLTKIPNERAINLPAEFGPEFSRFFKYHEIAHCMGASEPEGDRAAARFILKNGKDPKKSLEFLEIVKSIRASNLLFHNMPPHYYGTFQGIDTAIKDYKQQNGVHLTAPEIWTEALERSNYHPSRISDIVQIAHARADIKKSYDYAGMANYVRGTISMLPSADHKNLAARLANGAEFFGKMTGPASP